MEMEQNSVQTTGKSRIAEFFGQFADPNFYWELAKVAIKEVIKAAALALTGTITFYITKKFSGDALPQSTTQPNSPSLSQKAFGGNDSYQNQYNRSSSYYPTATTQPAATFPGFGAR